MKEQAQDTTTITTGDRYADRGVSSSKKGLHEIVAKLPKGLFPNAFCKVFPDDAGDPAYCQFKHADGAGTKSSLAWVYWKETGDISVWKGIAQDSMVMNLDDLACLGVTNQRLGYLMSLGRNKRLVPDEVLAAIIGGTQELTEEWEKLGINMYYAGGETADVGDLVRTVIVDGSLGGRMARKDVIDPNILPGQVIISFSSTGQASYESEENYGLGSNGFTSARHDMFNKDVALKYPDSYDPGGNEELIYCGENFLTSDFNGVHMAKAILSPTRTYMPIVAAFLKEVPLRDIGALVHCSGGGQTKALNFMPKENVQILKNNLFEAPLFDAIQEASGEPWKNMLKTFNCGSRLEAYVDQSVADRIICISKSFGVDARVSGLVRVRKQYESPLVIHYKGEKHEYSF